MFLMMALALAATTAPKPTKQAEDLGLRLARANTLTAVAPVLADKEVEEVVHAHPEWSAEEAAIYRSTARRVADADIERIVIALGHAYAKDLSIGDLTQLVTVLESSAAAHRRKIDPGAFEEALKAVGTIDFKRNTLAAFCAEMGKGCPVK